MERKRRATRKAPKQPRKSKAHHDPARRSKKPSRHKSQAAVDRSVLRENGVTATGNPAPSIQREDGNGSPAAGSDLGGRRDAAPAHGRDHGGRDEGGEGNSGPDRGQ